MTCTSNSGLCQCFPGTLGHMRCQVVTRRYLAEVHGINTEAQWQAWKF